MINYQNSALMHRERRKFFRTALKEMALVMTDQPGLLGPKVTIVVIGYFTMMQFSFNIYMLNY